MFGNFNPVNNNLLVEKVDFQIQEDGRYTSANNEQVVIIDTALARVYINNDSYFSSVPESVWNAQFTGEPTPGQLLERKIGSLITDGDIAEFQALLKDLIGAEFRSKNTAQLS